MGRPEGTIRISDDLHALLDAAPDAVIAVDAAGRIAYANARVAATFGIGSEELLDQPVELLLPERSAAVHVGHRDGYLARPMARPMSIGLDLAGRHRDGHEFPVEISLAPSTWLTAGRSSRPWSTSAPASRSRCGCSVGNVEPMLRRLIGEHVRLIIDLDAETGSARLDASQLDQVLMNLVVNAP